MNDPVETWREDIEAAPEYPDSFLLACVPSVLGKLLWKAVWVKEVEKVGKKIRFHDAIGTARVERGKLFWRPMPQPPRAPKQ